MSIYLKLAFPLLAVGLTMIYGFYKKKDKNFLIPGFVLIAAAFVNAVIGISLS